MAPSTKGSRDGTRAICLGVVIIWSPWSIEKRGGGQSEAGAGILGVQTIVFIPNPSTIAKPRPRHGNPFRAKALRTPFDLRLNRAPFRRTVHVCDAI